MKQAEINELTEKELREKLELEKENFDKLKFNHSISELENPLQLRYKRKTIARLLTRLNSGQASAKAETEKKVEKAAKAEKKTEAAKAKTKAKSPKTDKKSSES